MLTGGADVMPLDELAGAAARILACRGYVDPHDVGEWPNELAGELAALAELGCCPWCPGWCPSCPVTLTPDALADHWVADKEDEYERSLPAWRCDCGAVYKVLSEWEGHTASYSVFYHLGDDALAGPLCAGAARPDSDEDCVHDSCGDILFGAGCSLGGLAGTSHINGYGRVAHSSACPACGRRFADVIADRASAQQALFSRPARPRPGRREAPRRAGKSAAAGTRGGPRAIVGPGQRQVIDLGW